MEKMLDTLLFGGYTAQDVLLFAGGAAFFLIIILILKRAVRREFRKEDNEYFETAECSGCGWNGEVSVLAGRCPICNNTLGVHQIKTLPKKSSDKR